MDWKWILPKQAFLLRPSEHSIAGQGGDITHKGKGEASPYGLRMSMNFLNYSISRKKMVAL